MPGPGRSPLPPQTGRPPGERAAPVFSGSETTPQNVDHCCRPSPGARNAGRIQTSHRTGGWGPKFCIAQPIRRAEDRARRRSKPPHRAAACTDFRHPSIFAVVPPRRSPRALSAPRQQKTASRKQRRPLGFLADRRKSLHVARHRRHLHRTTGRPYATPARPAAIPPMASGSREDRRSPRRRRPGQRPCARVPGKPAIGPPTLPRIRRVRPPWTVATGSAVPRR